MGRLKALAPRVQALGPRIAAQGQQPKASGDQWRGSSTQRGYGYRWQQESKAWLREHPFCVQCERQRLITVATEVDHITPHRGDQRLFWDRSNWQSMCKPHHSAKTARGE